jgi:hypothetical protein
MQLPNAEGVVDVAPVAKCQMCGHLADHALTPDDFHDAEEIQMAYKGQCSECKECQENGPVIDEGGLS